MKLKEKMANAKAYMQKNQRKFILMMCSIVIVGGIVAGTLAWLASRTDPVINNFIGSNLQINLLETEGEDQQYTFQMIPGDTIDKNPVVTVLENSEACWLFLQVKESDAQANGSGIEVSRFGNPIPPREGPKYKYLNYALQEGWIPITEDEAKAMNLPVEEDGVVVNTYYYRLVGEEGTALAEDQPFEILEGNKVTVNDWIINEELSETQLNSNPVEITFTPIAIQQLGFPSLKSAAEQVAGEYIKLEQS